MILSTIELKSGDTIESGKAIYYLGPGGLCPSTSSQVTPCDTAVSLYLAFWLRSVVGIPLVWTPSVMYGLKLKLAPIDEHPASPSASE